MSGQDGDVLSAQTSDGGNICVEAGIVTMSGGLRTAVYLSLFGGNEDHAGQSCDCRAWWGNLDTSSDAQKQISRTQFLLQTIPATTANLIRLRDAVALDLQWLLDGKIASNVSTVIIMPELNSVNITVTIEANGIEFNFNFTENWKAAA